MSCVTAIERRSGEPGRRADDRHDGDVRPPVTDVRFPWYRDARKMTELTANGNIIAVIRRSWKERFS